VNDDDEKDEEGVKFIFLNPRSAHTHNRIAMEYRVERERDGE
jgi:hypothetical protein